MSIVHFKNLLPAQHSQCVMAIRNVVATVVAVVVAVVVVVVVVMVAVVVPSHQCLLLLFSYYEYCTHYSYSLLGTSTRESCEEYCSPS